MNTNEIYVRDISVNHLFDWFDQRCLAVPEMQREFVWNAKRAVALLDSMYRGYRSPVKVDQARVQPSRRRQPF